MMQLNVKSVLTSKGWLRNQKVSIDTSGVVKAIASSDEHCKHHLIPAFVNAHSHAFQFAMAGLAEQKTHSHDDFWTWRELMYDLAEKISDSELFDIASFLYQHMLESGYNAVVEFHYLHRCDKQENLRRAKLLIEAARNSGIRMCMVPVFYHFGNFSQPPSHRQKMFTHATVDTFIEQVEDLKKAHENEQTKVGIGVHSLRAANIEQVNAILDTSTRPFHIHIAEQIKEVKECKQQYSLTPIELLYERCANTPDINLVHATHLKESEIESIVTHKSNVVLCPATEANLGDGIFPTPEFINAGGSIAIGSDSHINMNPFEEMRLLEYAQRLTKRKRMVICNSDGANASFLYEKIISGGEKASKLSTTIKTGEKLNALLIDEDHPYVIGKENETLIASLCYSADRTAITCHYVNGNDILATEKRRQKIRENYQKSYRNLLKRLS